MTPAAAPAVAGLSANDPPTTAEPRRAAVAEQVRTRPCRPGRKRLTKRPPATLIFRCYRAC